MLVISQFKLVEELENVGGRIRKKKLIKVAWLAQCNAITTFEFFSLNSTRTVLISCCRY